VRGFFQNAKFAAISLACVLLSFLFFAVFVYTGVNHRLGNTMDKIGHFAVVSPALIAIVLALASLIWNRRKAPGLIALMVSIVGIWVLFALGG
jgi:cytochrome bd-type quinol oxidase subunit 2